MLDRWVPYRTLNAGVKWRVIGFPHAGGTAAFYRGWRAYMPADLDFCPVELPGHGGRIEEMPFTNLAELVSSLQLVLAPLLTVPFAFFGHSAGACIAFEAARMLRGAGGRSAAHLFLSGRRAPGEARGAEAMSDRNLMEMLVRYGSTPAVVLDREDLMAAILKALRADLTLVDEKNSTIHAGLSCPLTVFGGIDDAIDIAALEAWQQFTTAGFRVRMFPGDHFYVSKAGKSLLAEMAQDLRSAALPTSAFPQQ